MIAEGQGRPSVREAAAALPATALQFGMQLTLGIVGHCRTDPHKERMPVEDAILPPVADYLPSDDRARVYRSCGLSPRWQSERNKAVEYYREARSSDLMRVSEIGGAGSLGRLCRVGS